VPILTRAAGKLPGKAVQQVGVPYTFDGLDIEQEGSDSLIRFDDANSITVLGVTALTADDFVFVA
jgi:serralysin